MEEQNKRLNTLTKVKSEISISQIALKNNIKQLTTKLQETTESNKILQQNLEKFKFDLDQHVKWTRSSQMVLQIQENLVHKEIWCGL